MASRAESTLYSSNEPITVRNVEASLIEYHKDAVTALIFLKNIRSIKFQIRNGQTEKKCWQVEAEKPAGHMAGISRFRIEDKSWRENSLETRQTEWMVACSMLELHEIPENVRATRERHKLEARCGIAAPIAPARCSGLGRLFLGAPTDHVLGLPVHISAVSLPSSYEEISADRAWYRTWQSRAIERHSLRSMAPIGTGGSWRLKLLLFT